MNKSAYSGPRQLGPFSSCCSIWLLLLSPSMHPAASRDTQAGETCELSVIQRGTARHGRSFKTIRPCINELKWRRYSADPAIKAISQTTSWRQLTITTLVAVMADVLTYCVPIWGCLLHIVLQIFTLWQKSKVGVHIIFEVFTVNWLNRLWQEKMIYALTAKFLHLQLLTVLHKYTTLTSK